MERYDIEEIEYPLDITEQYFRDIAQYPSNLTREQESALIESARKGHTAARELIVLSCIAYVIKVASRYFQTLATHHDEFLDLISVGHLEVVQMLDIALTKQNCFSYLYMRAKFAIRKHSYFYSDLIVRAESSDRKTQVSLDVLQESAFDLPQSAISPTEDITNEALFEAINSLTEKQREVMIRHYGLFGQPEEQLPDIDRIDVSSGRHRMALINLRKKLADRLK